MKKTSKAIQAILLVPFVVIAAILLIGTELMLWAIGLITYLPVRILLAAMMDGVDEVKEELAEYLTQGREILGVISWVES